jgi:hypothetical protein
MEMSRSKSSSDSPADAQTSEKVVMSFRLPTQLASWLRKKADDEGGSLNEIAVTALDDLRSWFSATKPVAELLEADRKAFGDNTREYLRRLLQYRYDELAKDPRNVGQKTGGPPARK